MMPIDLQQTLEDMGQSALAPMRSAFEGDERHRERVAVVEADTSRDGVCLHCGRSDSPIGENADAAEIRQAAMRDVLQFLAGVGDVRQVGWRCVLAHWLITRGESQEQLAARHKVTGGAVSRALKAFRNEITLFLRGNAAPR